MTEPSQTDCGCESGECGVSAILPRRDFLKIAGVGTLSWLAVSQPLMAGPFTQADFKRNAPDDKKLHPDWIRSLTERGEPAVYRGKDLESIGMPVGGLCAGQLYLGGDGKLWHWDIFNHYVSTFGEHYANPMKPASPLEQGFALQVAAGGQTQTRSLDHSGFSDIRFRGEYPMAWVSYRDDGCPVEATLKAFSPFIPLNTDDSSLPATVLHYTLKNASKEPVEVSLMGWMENAVCLYNRQRSGTRRNRMRTGEGHTFLDCAAEKAEQPTHPPRPEVLFEDWNKETYAGWTVEGTAFGKRPIKRSEAIPYQGDLGGEGDRMVNTHASAPAADVGARDAKTGRLTSDPFTIERDYIVFWIGGGSHEGKTCMNLLVDGKVARTATGQDNNKMSLRSFEVAEFAGKQARLEIVDADTGPWGNIGVGRITFSDTPADSEAFEELYDFGTMGLALLGKPAEIRRSSVKPGSFEGSDGTEAAGPLAEPLISGLGRTVKLAPGKSATVAFVVTWHFPNLSLDGMGKVGRHYATRFKDAGEVAKYVASNYKRLEAETQLWHDTWYDSTLPRWFLDRTFLNAGILATSTAFRFKDGRFYGWEGVGCCAGTCTHVWHYAHAPGRLFPELERLARERNEYDIGFDADTGRIRFRGEHNDSWAVDGQSGSILRTYREHQMSADDGFLKRLWPKVKKSIEFMMAHDAGQNGTMDGPQPNTLDADWFGQVAWLSSLYVAALRAGEAMAHEMGDAAFADTARRIADAGSRNINERLFNGEYYYQLPDPANPKVVGSYDGCEIDQVFGQSWAYQVGLGRILPQPRVRQALEALWNYNFTPDVGPFRKSHTQGRWFAMAGEGGLLMCSWPKGEESRVSKDFDYYFNECMTGFEYQVAGHMLREGMLTEGLAVTRAIHDRYHPSRRNPWNEIECGDHYARAMASYGVFIAACGYESHGPKEHLGFAPRMSPGDFKAPFTTAEGWGSYSQKLKGEGLTANIALKWGRLRLKTLAMELAREKDPKQVKVLSHGEPVENEWKREGTRLWVTLAKPLMVKAGQSLLVHVS